MKLLVATTTAWGVLLTAVRAKRLTCQPGPFKATIQAVAIAICLAILPCAAQTVPATSPKPPVKGRIIFSRSTDENGQTMTQAPAAAGEMAPPPVAKGEPVSTQLDAERQAVVFTAFDLDVRLHPADRQIAVRALVTIRNGAQIPLTRIPLQISSSLNWERIRLVAPEGQGGEIAFKTATLNSDADHTGQLHEAVVPLDKTLRGPLAPGQALQLDVTYSGQIAASAQRLLAVGAPNVEALRADWDQIGVAFTGLRGFGNVVWYPVSSVPVLLGDGARLFDEIGQHKLRLSGARFRLRLTVEFPHGQAPTVALINGHSVPLKMTESGALDQGQEVDGIATADSGSATLGFETPSLFTAIRASHSAPSLTAWTLPEHEVSIAFWNTAAEAVTPFLQGWLGERPRSQLTLLDLPDPDDAPFETGSLLAAPLSETGSKSNPDALTGVLVHALAHAWITPPNPAAPPPAWLNEGAATFMSSLWVEKRQGRDAALRALEAGRAALALAEPESPGQSAGQPLAQAISPVYYRTKAAYVLWMLRDLAGDQALSAALRAYNPADPASFAKLLAQSAPGLNLSWFFADWVDADKGLPDLSIEGVFPTSASAGNWLTAVTVANSGYAQTEVPLTVRSGSGSDSDATSITRRIRIPARGRTTERVLTQGKPTEVQINDGAVPEIQASVHLTSLDGAAPSASTAPRP
jgi:hypothetical protein